MALHPKIALALGLMLALAPGWAGGAAPPGDLVSIPGGAYTPFYALTKAGEAVRVSPFRLQRRPVTNAEYLAFTEANPAWRPGAVPPLFADGGYLSHWASPDALGPGASPQQPVTWVSWFAAKAYCESGGMRLPTELEWEYVAAASLTARDGRGDAAWRGEILAWYAQPTSAGLGAVGQGAPNAYGVHDLHGLIWEWVLEFNSALVSADSRESQSADKTRFCGAGAITASDKSDYASFMRYAFRSALEAPYTTGTLGFRCAADPPGSVGGEQR